MKPAIPNYKDLDRSGEVLEAVARLEARASEPASQDMFDQLIAPLLSADVKTVLEFGCGTAALARKIARAAPRVMVYASDKSDGMLLAARQIAEAEGHRHLQLEPWDVLDDAAFPFQVERFDLIVSSVVIPYFDNAEVGRVIRSLSSRLSAGGTLAFIEQDQVTDTVNFPKFDLRRRVLRKDSRNLTRTQALGLRPLLRQAGLTVLPRRSFLWTDDTYGCYTRDLLERLADAACGEGHLRSDEVREWKTTLRDLAASEDFFYGMVYHLVAARRPRAAIHA